MVIDPPDIKVGNLVMIDTRNMKTKRPSKNLDHKKIGPVTILKKIGTRAFRVELPPSIQALEVFRVSMLEPYRTSCCSKRQCPPPRPEEVEGQEIWEVELVADCRRNKGKKRVEYLVFWKGFLPEQATWEPWENLEGTAEEAVKEFHKGNPWKPRERDFR